MFKEVVCKKCGRQIVVVDDIFISARTGQSVVIGCAKCGYSIVAPDDPRIDYTPMKFNTITIAELERERRERN